MRPEVTAPGMSSSPMMMAGVPLAVRKLWPGRRAPTQPPPLGEELEASAGVMESVLRPAAS